MGKEGKEEERGMEQGVWMDGYERERTEGEENGEGSRLGRDMNSTKDLEKLIKSERIEMWIRI